ncbi:uncharacterized protein SOCEGT47_027940 [Sorangium cellulosum]|uniref:Uncharacterized protein n=1 Tax=Sorangium cellulosum TaxID=56 RepID=A0A4P2Q0G7_SORCE|nr:uncharacterized protein SOCEGT47_027940 [Sorangium cellulosum]
MSPAQREQAVAAFLGSVSQEEIDEREAMAEGDPHLAAKMEARDTRRSSRERTAPERGLRAGPGPPCASEIDGVGATPQPRRRRGRFRRGPSWGPRRAQARARVRGQGRPAGR